MRLRLTRFPGAALRSCAVLGTLFALLLACGGALAADPPAAASAPLQPPAAGNGQHDEFGRLAAADPDPARKRGDLRYKHAARHAGGAVAGMALVRARRLGDDFPRQCRLGHSRRRSRAGRRDRGRARAQPASAASDAELRARAELAGLLGMLLCDGAAVAAFAGVFVYSRHWLIDVGVTVPLVILAANVLIRWRASVSCAAHAVAPARDRGAADRSRRRRGAPPDAVLFGPRAGGGDADRVRTPRAGRRGQRRAACDRPPVAMLVCGMYASACSAAGRLPKR